MNMTLKEPADGGGSGERWQAVSCTCPVAGISSFAEFATGVGAPLVDAAAHLMANLTRQGGAAYRHVIGAAHAAGVAIDRHGEQIGRAHV